MKVWLDDLKITSEIMRAEEITEHTYFITDIEYEGIKETIANNGFIWIDGNKVRYSGKQPTPEHKFNEQTKVWEIDEELHKLEHDRKVEQVWEYIKNLRAEKNSLGFYVSSVDKWFHSDQPSINNYQIVGLSILLKKYEPQLWKTMDGTWVQMTEELFAQVMSAMEEHGKFNFEVAEKHYQELKKSQDPNMYDYTKGWKENYIDITKD